MLGPVQSHPCSHSLDQTGVRWCGHGDMNMKTSLLWLLAATSGGCCVVKPLQDPHLQFLLVSNCDSSWGVVSGCREGWAGGGSTLLQTICSQKLLSAGRPPAGQGPRNLAARSITVTWTVLSLVTRVTMLARCHEDVTKM